MACMSINSKVFEEPYSSTYCFWNRKEENIEYLLRRNRKIPPESPIILKPVKENFILQFQRKTNILTAGGFFFTCRVPGVRQVVQASVVAHVVVAALQRRGRGPAEGVHAP